MSAALNKTIKNKRNCQFKFVFLKRRLKEGWDAALKKDGEFICHTTCLLKRLMALKMAVKTISGKNAFKIKR